MEKIKRGSQLHKMKLKYCICVIGTNLGIYVILFLMRLFLFTIFTPPPYFDLFILLSLIAISYFITNYIINHRFYHKWFR